MNKTKKWLITFFHSYLWIMIPLLFIDQLTKLLALNQNWQFEIIPNFFYFTTVRNTGAAWSMLSGHMGLLAVISAVVGSAILVVRIKYDKQLDTLKKILVAVILAGAWGNFIDRAFYKLLLGSEGVVDFIHFRFWNYDFPIFNFADMCVVIGILGLAVVIFLEDFGIINSKTNSSKEEEHDQIN